MSSVHYWFQKKKRSKLPYPNEVSPRYPFSEWMCVLLWCWWFYSGTSLLQVLCSLSTIFMLPITMLQSYHDLGNMCKKTHIKSYRRRAATGRGGGRFSSFLFVESKTGSIISRNRSEDMDTDQNYFRCKSCPRTTQSQQSGIFFSQNFTMN